ncbi:immunity 49 family protein [Streptomyces sp. URMC 129]
MATRVTRHAFPAVGDAACFLRLLGESTVEDVERLSESPRSFSLTFGSAVSTAMAHCLHDPEADKFETWDAWVTAMQIGSALFASAAATEGTVQCRIAHKTRTIPATGPQHYTDAGNWLTAFWLAVICRDQRRMTELSRVPLSLLRASGAEFDEYIYAWVDSLQTYWLERPGLGEKLKAAFDGTDPGQPHIVPRELILKILYPPLNLFYRFLARDYQQFHTALAQALELHKEYWDLNEDRRLDTEGAVALGPLAVACLAFDAGFPIEVESEYLPRHLLQRSWLGEFET